MSDILGKHLLEENWRIFKCYARLNYYIRIIEGDTWLFGGFFDMAFFNCHEKNIMKHNSEMFCFNFLSSGKLCSEGTRNDCKLEDEGNVSQEKEGSMGNFFVFLVHVLHVGETDNSQE